MKNSSERRHDILGYPGSKNVIKVIYLLDIQLHFKNSLCVLIQYNNIL